MECPYGWTAPMIPHLISNSSTLQLNMKAEWLETFDARSFLGLPFPHLLRGQDRKEKIIAAGNLPPLLAGFLVVLANKMVVYARCKNSFLDWAGDMAFVAAPMYIAEIADSKIRGFLSSVVYPMMLPLAVYFHLKLEGYDEKGVSWIPIVSRVLVYAATFKIGLGMVPIVITAEIFQESQSFGMTIADGM
ncbi:hypothetical protein JTB14_026426 [Gonioctena quinquepunctata]|nr:hypothetical protein JTB14_026426 [Gonioctena quinquepunctata]